MSKEVVLNFSTMKNLRDRQRHGPCQGTPVAVEGGDPQLRDHPSTGGSNRIPTKPSEMTCESRLSMRKQHSCHGMRSGVTCGPRAQATPDLDSRNEGSVISRCSRGWAAKAAARHVIRICLETRHCSSQQRYRSQRLLINRVLFCTFFASCPPGKSVQ